MKYVYLVLILWLPLFWASAQTEKLPFQELDVFSLEYASDPQVSPDGDFVIYRRNGFDIMEDKSVGSIWIYNLKEQTQRKLTSLDVNEHNAQWSPNGSKIAFISSTDEGNEIYVYSLKSNTYARISQLEYSPSSLAWSPDGKQIAFTMFVSSKAPSLVTPPKKPKGAEWADPPRLTTRLKHETDGTGYIKDGFYHIFVMDAIGMSPRQVTSGNFHHKSNLSWTKDSKFIVFSANRSPNWEYDYEDTNIFNVDILTGKITQLSATNGPDFSPSVSPDGKYIAYLGYEDKTKTYQINKLHVMKLDGSDKKIWMNDMDRTINQIQWREDSKAIYYSYEYHGDTKIARISNGKLRKELCANLGGIVISRPYSGGTFSVSKKDEIIYTKASPNRPADLVQFNVKREKTTQLTHLNDDLLNFRELGQVEEIWYNSTVDNRRIQGWIVKPPYYDASKKYPLLVENHGGPILNYGPRFAAEMQLYAAAGYIVFYPNPRGSTGYGEEFGNLLYNNYPGDDYQDVMDGVDYLIAQKLAYEDQLFVTGGSAGGIMTAWIIGKNNRFEAAVVHKPVINWISKTLVADNYFQYAEYRYPGQPWENFENYWKFSPLSLVGNISTPTMVIVGMNDLRTPPSEAKQLYHALKIRKIETMLVEIPGASHSIASRPSQLITKVAHTIAWCNLYRTDLSSK